MAYADEVLLDNPKGYWKFDETVTGNGSTVVDYSGNGRNMVLASNGPYLYYPMNKKLLSDKCRYLDGNVQYAYRTYDGFFDFTSAVTMELWGYLPINIGGYGFCKVQSSGYQIEIWKNKLRLTVHINGSYLAKETTFVANENFRHYVVSYTGRYFKLFIDGQNILTYDNVNTYSISTASTSLMFGANPNGSGSGIDAGWHPQGFFSNAAIYNYAVSDERILAHYNSTIRHVAVKINDFITADTFLTVAVDLTGNLVGVNTVGSGEQLLTVETDLPVMVMIFPLEGSAWMPNTVYVQDDLVFPTNPMLNPYYYKRLVAGTSDVTEPVWSSNLVDTIDDGATTGAWQVVSKLSKPSCAGPLIPFAV